METFEVESCVRGPSCFHASLQLHTLTCLLTLQLLSDDCEKHVSMA